MKTHEELDITFAQLGALLGVRELLRNGYLHHEPNNELSYDTGGEHKFNMNVTCRNTVHCGSIGCIGGMMGFILYSGNFREASLFVIENDNFDATFHRLFFPPRVYNWDTITPEQAIKAIDNFLDGRSPWDDVLSKEKNRLNV